MNKLIVGIALFLILAILIFIQALLLRSTILNALLRLMDYEDKLKGEQK